MDNLKKLVGDIENLIDEGKSIKDIAKELHLDQMKIRRTMKNNNVLTLKEKRRMALKKECYELFKEGKTMVEISSILGHSPDTIRWWLNDGGMGMKVRPRISIDDEQDAIDLFREGFTNREISKRLDIDIDIISSWKKNAEREDMI